VPADPSYAYLHPDGASIAFWRDAERTAREVDAFSRSDGRAYRDLVRTLDALLGVALPLMAADPARPSPLALARAAASATRNLRGLRGLLPLVTSPAEATVCERFEHPVVRGALLALAGGAGPVAAEGSGLGHLMLALLHRVGVLRPIGGMQRLSENLAARLQASGGSIRTGTAVREILVSNGRTRGVVLADGSEISARAVVATCDPYRALIELAPAEAVGESVRARVRAIPSNAHGAAPAVMNLALGARAELHERFRRRDCADIRAAALLLGTEQSTRSSYEAAARGDIAEDPLLWAAVTSAADPSQAPPGQDSLYVYIAANPVVATGGWPYVQPVAEKQVLAKLAQFFDGLDSELGRWFETPDELSARLGVRNGNVFHVDLNLTRIGPMRPAWGLAGGRTPVQGLVLGSAGSAPGPGVFGAPGHLAARRASAYLAGQACR
ncbi:phytoene desaturase family protein, partial [Mycobacterium sp.]|uniref:phytoene desaturase family protein n=1 Tax=Mycobacterium sp. TaxID=1785 RepID=UPI003BB11019